MSGAFVEGGVGDEHHVCPFAVAQQARAQLERRVRTARFVGGQESREGVVQSLLVAFEGGKQARVPSTRHEEHARVAGQGIDALLRFTLRLVESAGVPLSCLHARAHVHDEHRVSRLRGSRDPPGVREGEGERGREEQQREQAEIPKQLLQPDPALALPQRLAPQGRGRHHHPAAAGAQAVEHEEHRDSGEREQPDRPGEMDHRRWVPWRR